MLKKTNTVKPPKYVQENARKALLCINGGSDAMTTIGRRRATQLASGRPIGEVTLKKMSQFARHKANASYKGNPCEDKGAVAWLGWGNSLKNGKGVSDASKWAKTVLKRN